MKDANDLSRRKFIHNLAVVGLSVPLFSSVSKCNSPKSTNTLQQKNTGKLGVALVGLGGYASGQLAPALLETEHCYLAGIVTGTPSKISSWQQKYNIPDNNIYSYDNFDKIKDNKDIDIIYVVLPNALHAEYVVRAAAAGKHVITEKPMAITVEDCDKMIAACKKAGKMLSVGYRLHFEPYNLEMQKLGQQKVFGAINKMQAGFGFSIGDAGQWRLKKSLAGGGPLQDLGIYCIQGFCYTTGISPIAVTATEGAKTNPQKFREVEQSLRWQFEMPGGILCDGQASYDHNMNFLKAQATNGSFELISAFNYGGQAGKTPNGAMNFMHINQQAKQMDDFALAIKHNRPTPVPGEMGRRDVRLIQSIYEAMQTGKRIEIK